MQRPGCCLQCLSRCPVLQHEGGWEEKEEEEFSQRVFSFYQSKSDLGSHIVYFLNEHRRKKPEIPQGWTRAGLGRYTGKNRQELFMLPLLLFFLFVNITHIQYRKLRQHTKESKKGN